MLASSQRPKLNLTERDLKDLGVYCLVELGCYRRLEANLLCTLRF